MADEPTAPSTEAVERELPADGRKMRVNETVTEIRKFEHPREVSVGPQFAPRARPDVDTKTLEDLLDSAECGDRALSVERYWPLLDEAGKPLPSGTVVPSMPVMPLDKIREYLKQLWGGGNYRVYVHDSHTGEKLGKFKALLVSIQLTECPAKRTMATTASAEGDAEDAEMVRVERRIAHEKRKSTLEAEQMRARREIKEEQLRMERLLDGNGNGGGNQFAMVMELMKTNQAATEARLAQEKSAAEARAQRDKDDAERRAKEVEDRLRREKDEADKRAKEDKDALLATMKELMAGFKEATAAKHEPRENTAVEMVKALAPMLAAKPPDNTAFQAVTELIKAGQTTQTQLAEFRMKSENREERNYAAERAQLLNLLIQQKDNPSSLRDTIMLMGEMKKMTRDEIEFAHAMAGGEEPGGGDGYDPRLGFLGNAGRAIFAGLSDLVKEATRNPAILQLLMRLLGTGRPTQQQMAQAAYRLAQQGQPVLLTPPAGQPQPQQRQLFAPQFQTPSLLTPPAAGTVQPAAGTQAVAGLPPTVPTMPGVPPPVPSATQQQVQAATELEGEAMGMAVGDVAEETPETRLRSFVTDAIKECCDDMQDKRAAREWWAYGDQWWNGDFKQALADLPDDQQRAVLIQSRCEPEQWNRLIGLLQADTTGGETAKFYEGLRALVAAQKKPTANGQAVQQPPPRALVVAPPAAAPPPVPQAPVAMPAPPSAGPQPGG
jgi:hypothetical protein